MSIKSKTKFLNFLRKINQFSFFEQRLVKITSGKSPNYIFSKLVPSNYLYSSNSIRRIARNGIQMELDISDYLGHYIYFGFIDAGHNKLFSLCKKGDFVIDVGSNIGYVLLSLARIVGEQGKIFGFEPDPFNYNKCSLNVKLNNFANIHLENVGLGHKNDTFNLSVDTISNRGGNRISLKPTKNESVEIKVIRLDDYILQNKVEKINLIKIDVEGFELNVLKGAESVLLNYKPILFIELDDNNLKQQGQSALELIEYIQQFKYNIQHAETGEKVDLHYDFSNKHFDIICQ